MPRIFLFCLLLLLIAATGNAQVVSSKYWRADVDTGKLYFRTNPVGLIDFFDMNFTIGGEYRLNHSWSATMDAGYIFYSQYAGRVKRASGILLRPGIRKYAGKRKDFFLDLQLHYKEVNYRVEDWLDKNVVNGVATYEEYKKFRYHKRVFGAHFTIGGREYLSKNRRWFFEVYGGIGLHFKKEGMPDETNSRYEERNTIRVFSNSSGVTKRISPAFPFGIRLVYRFR